MSSVSDELWSEIQPAERSSRARRLLGSVPPEVPDCSRYVAARIDEEDVLESARQKHGIGTMAQIKYAILEKSGDISIIPREGPSAS